MKKLMIFLLVLFSIGIVSAVPLPHGFHGSVTYSSGGNVAGEIIAKISGVEKGNASIVNGIYDLVAESEESGAIYFYIKGNDSKITEYPFAAFNITELNLIVPKESTISGNGNSPGGSSGGGSSSASSSTTTITPQGIGTIYAVSETQVTDGISKEMNAGDAIKFQISGGEHTLNLEAITGNFARITVQSSPVTFVLEIGDEKKIDFENDGFYDLEVKLTEITDTPEGTSGKAKIKIQSVHEEVSQQTATTNQTGENNETNGGAGITGNVIGFAKSGIGIGLIVGIVIIIAGIGIIAFKKKRLG